jgi:outer membrane protein assembly factor BamB
MDDRSIDSQSRTNDPRLHAGADGLLIQEGKMMKLVSAVAPLVVVLVLLSVSHPLTGSAQAPSSGASEWLTWGYDSERSGWNRAETTLSKDNVSGLALQWSTELSPPRHELVLSTLTAPLVAEGVATPQGRRTLVFVVGSDDTVFAIDADNGKVVWQKAFPNTLTPPQASSWLCSNTQNATPVIDRQKGIIFFNTSDGKLRGLSLGNGEQKLTPIDFVTPFARNWSLNLIDDVIYTPTARGCGAAIANITAMDVSDLAHPHISRLYTSGGRPAGAWGRGGVVKGPRGIITQTADGLYDPGAGIFGETVMALAPKELRIIDSFTPSNWKYLNSRDLDFGSSGPVVFPFQGRTVVATIAKEAVLYLLDANNLGGTDHATPLYQSPRLGNDEVMLGGRGVWGAISTAADAQGHRFVYVPMWGPASKETPPFKFSYGDAPKGSVMALEITSQGGKLSATPTWISRDMHVPDPPVIANGVVYAVQTGENTVQNPQPGGDIRVDPPPAPAGTGRAGAVAGQPPAAAPAARGANDPEAARLAAQRAAKFRATPVTNLVLYAFDAATGKQLYSSEKLIPGWVHYGEPVVAAGKVFVVTWDAKVYAFGLKK